MGALLFTALGLAGCGSSSMPSDADVGKSDKVDAAVKVESVRTWLDPDGTKEYDDSAVAVVRNTSDKLANGVTLRLRWDNYVTAQYQAIVLQPGERGVFVLGPYDAPPDVKGPPRPEVKVDGLKPGSKEPVVEFSGFKLDQEGKGCKLTGTTTNRFTHPHPGVSGLVAGLKDGKVVTGGSIFFEEPGLLPGKKGTFTATLDPLCPRGEVDEWVGFAQLSEKDLTDP